MIGKLRRKFILAAMASLFLVLLLIMGVVNFLNYRKVVADADATLDVLAANQGAFPESFSPEEPPFLPPVMQSEREDGGRGYGRGSWGTEASSEEEAGGLGRLWGRRSLSEETPFESRFFSVLYDAEGSVQAVDTGFIAAVTEEEAQAYAEAVRASGRQKGFRGDYRFSLSHEKEGDRIIFLDCTRALDNARAFLTASVGISLAGLMLVFLLVWLLSARIVRPISESYDKQKRFITDAGHELKTPLAIINADAEVLELDTGPSEWIDDIKAQTKRLGDLTADLIFLSRMEEGGPQLTLIDFSFSDMAQEQARSFAALALTQGKHFSEDIAPRVTCRGDEKSLRQLTGILLDNAVKYAPEGGSIRLTLRAQGKGVRLTVENDCEALDRDNLDHLFDRFYRGDKARSSEKAGYGIGLSIAKAVTEAHKGRITAASPDGKSLTVTVSLP